MPRGEAAEARSAARASRASTACRSAAARATSGCRLRGAVAVLGGGRRRLAPRGQVGAGSDDGLLRHVLGEVPSTAAEKATPVPGPRGPHQIRPRACVHPRTPEDPAAQVWSSRTGFAETAPVPVPSSGAALCPRGEPGGDGSPSPGPGGHPPRPRHHAGPVASRSRPPHARCRGRRHPGSGPRPSWPAAASARRGATPKEGPAPRVRPGRPTPATARGPARTLLRDSKKAAFHPCTGVARDGLPRTRTCGWVRVRWRCCGR